MTSIRAPTAAAPATVATVAIGSAIGLLWILNTVGHLGGVPSAPAPGTDFSWLTSVVIHVIAMVPLPWPIETTMSVVSACVVSGLLAWLYQRLIYNDWPAPTALVFVACLAANAVVIELVMNDHSAIPIMIAAVALVPGIRRMESVGDVQATMSFGLVLALLFLAGPALAPLVPILAAWVAFADPEARHDARAFIAMFLVAVTPTLLLITGIFGMLGPAGAARVAETVYVPAFTAKILDAESIQMLFAFVTKTVLPFGIVTVAYMFYRDRRWQPWSAAAVLGLPLYLVAGEVFFSWPGLPLAPAAAVLGGFASWLSVARLTPVLRWSSVAVMILTTVVSYGVLQLGVGSG